MKRAERWPCVFGTEFIREEIDARLYRDHPKIRFGDFRKSWREQHCSTLNPYGSESCPYTVEECGLAFYVVADKAMRVARRPGALFKSLAKHLALERADNKPLARDRYTGRTDGQQAGSTGLRGGPGAGPGRDVVPHNGGVRDTRTMGQPQPVAVPGSMGVRGPSRRCVSIEELLRGDGAGPYSRTPRRHEGETGSDDDGDALDPVPPPSPRRLGDIP